MPAYRDRFIDVNDFFARYQYITALAKQQYDVGMILSRIFYNML